MHVEAWQAQAHHRVLRYMHACNRSVRMAKGGGGLHFISHVQTCACVCVKQILGRAYRVVEDEDGALPPIPPSHIDLARASLELHLGHQCRQVVWLTDVAPCKGGKQQLPRLVHVEVALRVQQFQQGQWGAGRWNGVRGKWMGKGRYTRMEE